MRDGRLNTRNLGNESLRTNRMSGNFQITDEAIRLQLMINYDT